MTDEYEKPRVLRDPKSKKKKAPVEVELHHPLHEPYRRPTRKDWLGEDDDEEDETG